MLCYRDEDGKATEKQIINVRFHDQGYQPPMMIAKHGEVFVWGFHVQRLLEDNRVDLEDSIDLFKLGLYEKEDKITAERSKVLKHQLDTLGIGFDKLIEEHLKLIKHDCLDFIYNGTARGGLEQRLRTLPVHFRISVPAMWSMKARQRLRRGAKAAGMKLVVLSSEPENAVAYLLDDLATNQGGYIAESLPIGSKVIVIDLGCGTADRSTFQLKERLTRTSRLETINSSSGGACGAQMVNELILAGLADCIDVQRQGGVEALKTFLGLSDLKWRKKMLQQIDEVKNRFPVTAEYDVIIRGEGNRRLMITLQR